MKAIMYHYIREFNHDYPNFRFLDIKNFCKQLDFFESRYGFVTKEEWASAMRNKTLGNAKGKILLTFDDAMSCHFDYVFPELKRRKIWGIFYVPAQPYLDGEILGVHKIHLLCGAYSGKLLLETLTEVLSDEMIPDKKIHEFRQETYQNRLDAEGVAEFKRILNYYVSYEFRDSLINQVAQVLGYKFRKIKNFYISQENLKKMNLYGNVIGSHSVTHPVMSKLQKSDQVIEIKHSFEFLDSIGCIEDKTYCHPYGGFHSFNKTTIDVLNAEGVQYSFNVEARSITEDDLNSSTQFLPRFDCNQFPYGKAS